jgi:dihydroxyacetone kinase
MSKKSCDKDKKKDPKMEEAMKAMKKATGKPGGAMTRSNYDS